MGFRTWWRRTTGKKPNRPWVRPEFLGLALIAIALVAFALAGGQGPKGSPPPAATEKSEFVGIDPNSLPLQDCMPVCQADLAFQTWQSEHPGAQVLSKDAVFRDGRLIGYQVRYAE